MSSITFDGAIKILNKSVDIGEVSEAFKFLSKGISDPDNGRAFIQNLKNAGIDLQSLATRLATHDGGLYVGKNLSGTTVFYSGTVDGIPTYKIAENLGDGYRVIGKTKIGALFNTEVVNDVRDMLIGRDGIDDMWKTFSTEFVRHAEGNVMTLVYDALGERVYRTAELRALLDGVATKVTSIDGLDLEDLRTLARDVAYDDSSTTPVMLGASASCPPLALVLAAG